MNYRKAITVLVTLLTASISQANQEHVHKHHNHILANDHAPISVMGDHMHQAGGWMVSYRYMEMDMEGNLQGSNDVSPEQIATTLSNPFGPPTARVVPIQMTTTMHMFGAMYAPSDDWTFMAMLNYVDKEMDHLTFQGMAGTNRLGEFTTSASGIGDTKVAGLFRLHDDEVHHWHINIGLSLPTGDIKAEDDVLTPMNTRPTLRLPYAMQLGSGTYDIEPGVTYTGKSGALAWGGQFRSVLRVSENSENYSLGNIYQLSGWASYRVQPSLSFSLRAVIKSLDKIDGQDSQIAAPVQTANPDNYGGDYIDLGLGVNFVAQEGVLAGHRFALEFSAPLRQDVNGVQMEMQDMLVVGYQYAF